jgi:hypothetical protein
MTPALVADSAKACTLAEDGSGAWLVDGHVHIHPEFDRRRFFDAVAANFAAAARRLSLPATTPGVLMLTESSGAHVFEELAAAAGAEAVPGWSVSRTAEPLSLAMTRSGGARVYLVSGRQIVTSDRLEVLALAARDEVPDGLPLETAVARVKALGGVPVIPWGFGKWTGARRRRMADFLQSPVGDGVLLGDNGGRLALAPIPALLREAQQRGLPVVPGSDPLPFASQSERAGRYGFVLTAGVDSERPARTVVQYLLSRKDQPCPFGRLTPLPAFLISQLRMQWRARSQSR